MPYAMNGAVSSDPSDGAIEITPQQYLAAIEGMCKGNVVSIDGGVFSIVPLAVPESVPLTEDELRVIALAQRDQLQAEATRRMAPLEDAVDLGIATEAESAQLLDWKRYRVELNRIELQPGYPGDIDWPTVPDTSS